MTEWENWQQHTTYNTMQAGEMRFKDKPHWVTQSYMYSLMTESRGIRVLHCNSLRGIANRGVPREMFFSP